ncbi:MAG: PAS domain S-box protein [Chloroflexi bacterium]|nr:PAS domain S-box protein [Chloroflexota bacterium]
MAQQTMAASKREIEDLRGQVAVLQTEVERRKEAGEALRESEERFRSLVENANDAIVVLQDGKVVFRNPLYETLLGYTVAETRDRLFLENVAPEDREQVRDYHARRIRGETAPEQYEVRILTRSGRKLTMEVRPRVIEYGGKPAAMVIMRDVTERVQQEEALRQSEERFRLLAENAQDMIYRYRIESSAYDYVSPGVFRILGYTPDDLYADPGLFRKAVHPDDESIAEEQERLKETEDFYVGPPIKRVHKSGQIVWTESRTTLLRDTAGTAVAIEGVVRDVTERKVAEEALRQSEERFRLLAENAQDIVYRVSARPERKVEYVSPSIERILGYSQEEYYADPSLVERTIHEDDRHLSLLNPLMGKTETQPRRLRCIAKDGRTVWMERRSSPIRDADGKIVGWNGISRDVTEQVRLLEQVRAGEERLRAFSRRLVETQEADRRFIALELHDEIGQLLTGIKMSQEEIGRSGEVNKRSLRKGFKLIEDAMKRVQDLSLDLRPAMLDHLGLVPTLKWYVKRYASRNGVEVKLRQTGVDRRFDPDLETAVYRIVQEGLTNVARHAKKDLATVQLRIIDNVLHLAVEDSGLGFDAETALDSPKSVGLVGMIERATSLGGELRVDSAPGRGTRLNATFPLNGNPRATE